MHEEDPLRSAGKKKRRGKRREPAGFRGVELGLLTRGLSMDDEEAQQTSVAMVRPFALSLSSLPPRLKYLLNPPSFFFFSFVCLRYAVAEEGSADGL